MTTGLVPSSIFEKAVLVDTSALYALADKDDQYHDQAKELLTFAQKEKLPLYVTNVVVIEAYRLILHRLGREKSLHFLEVLIEDVRLGIIRLERMSLDDESQGQSLVFTHRAHDITLTDSINFSVMLRMGIFKVFGFDDDCLIVGFERLYNGSLS